MSETTNILICGIGGQGTVLAGKIITKAALLEGKSVLSAETIGMAQRGGSVTSHIRIGKAYSPLVPLGFADFMLSFDASEAVRNVPYLKKSAVVIVNNAVAQPVSAGLSGAVFKADDMLSYLRLKANTVVPVDCKAECEALGSAKVTNMVLLGKACALGIFSTATITSAMKSLVKPEFYALNEKALCGASSAL